MICCGKKKEVVTQPSRNDEIKIIIPKKISINTESDLFKQIRTESRWGEWIEYKWTEPWQEIITYYVSYYFSTPILKVIYERLEKEFDHSQYYTDKKYFILGVPELRNCIDTRRVPITYSTHYFQPAINPKTDKWVCYHQIVICGSTPHLVKRATQIVKEILINI